MPRVQIFRHVLFLLGRHSGGIRLTRDTPGTKQSSRHIVFGQTRLSIVELTIAAMTWFHVCSPASGLFKGAVPAGRTRRSADLVSNAAPAFSLLRHRDGRRQARHASERSFALSARSHRRLGPWHRFGFRLPLRISSGLLPSIAACSPERQGSSLPRAPPSAQPSSRGGGRTPFFTSTSRVATPARHSRRETRTRRNIRSSRRHADLFLSSSSISVNSASTTFSLPDGGAVPDECCDWA